MGPCAWRPLGPPGFVIDRSGVIITKLAEEEDGALQGHAGVLTEAMNTLSAAMDAHRAALDSEVQAYGLLQAEKVNWLDAYKRSYRDLTRLYFKEPQRAETFFKPAPKEKKTEAPPAASVKPS